MNRLVRYVIRCAIVIVALFSISGLSFGSDASLAADDAAPPTTHTIAFTNNCPQPIWIAAFSAVKDVKPANGWELAPACNAATPGSCPGAGSKCQSSQCSCPRAAASDATNCFGAACVAGSAGTFHCATQTSMLVPAAYPSARIWGRTGCTGTGASLSCDTGDCSGKLDCFGVGTANRATLFEMSLANLNGLDNYDVSLVSGYNLPLTVQAVQPTDTPGWTRNTPYHNGQGSLKQSVITASAGSYEWLFNDATGSAITANSGALVPKFSTVLGGIVPDPSTAPKPYKLAWRTTSSTCQTGACLYCQSAADPLLTTCPALLRVTDSSLSCSAASNCPRQAPCSGGHCVTACDTPDDYCAGAGAGTATCNAQNNSFFYAPTLFRRNAIRSVMRSTWNRRMPERRFVFPPPIARPARNAFSIPPLRRQARSFFRRAPGCAFPETGLFLRTEDAAAPPMMASSARRRASFFPSPTISARPLRMTARARSFHFAYLLSQPPLQVPPPSGTWCGTPTTLRRPPPSALQTAAVQLRRGRSASRRLCADFRRPVPSRRRL